MTGVTNSESREKSSKFGYRKYIQASHAYNIGHTRAIKEAKLLVKATQGGCKNQHAILNVNEAAEYLGVHRDTVRRWTNDGYITPIENPDTSRRKYLMRHLWVFRELWLKKDGE